MRKLLPLWVAALLATSGGVVFAYPSLLGPTGGANMPVARCLKPGEIDVAIDYVGDDWAEGVVNTLVGTTETIEYDHTWNVRALCGVLPGLELGVGWTTQDYHWELWDWDTEALYTLDDTDKCWSFFGKYVFPRPALGFDWAVGAVLQNRDQPQIVNVSWNTPIGVLGVPFVEDVQEYYLVGTRMLASNPALALRGTIGVNWITGDIFRNNYDTATAAYIGTTEYDGLRPFLNLDLGLKSGLNITAEYQFANDDAFEDDMSTVAVRYPLGENFRIQAGLTNAFKGVLGNKEGHGVFAGIAYIQQLQLGGKGEGKVPAPPKYEPAPPKAPAAWTVPGGKAEIEEKETTGLADAFHIN